MIILNHSVSSDEENDSALDLSISSSRQKSPADAEADKPSYKLKKSMIRRYCKSLNDESFNFFWLTLDVPFGRLRRRSGVLQEQLSRRERFKLFEETYSQFLHSYSVSFKCGNFVAINFSNPHR